MLACCCNNIKIVKLLRDAGANLDTQNNDGDTALKLACDEGHVEIVDLLMDDETKN